MPEAVSVSVAKAVVAQLEAATFSQAIEPIRSYADFDLDLKEVERLRVDVVAVSTDAKTELASRGTTRYTVPVDIAVRKKFGADKQDDDTGRIETQPVDDLVLLTQEIHELFQPVRLTTFTAGVWQATDLMAAPVHEHLRNMRQFTGIVRVVFRVDKAIE